MSNDKEVINKMFKVIANQQKIIMKLEQMQNIPQDLEPNKVVKDEASEILKNLPPNLKAAIERLEVHGNEVRVKFNPGKASDAAFNLLQKVITNLQNKALLSGQSYIVKEVA